MSDELRRYASDWSKLSVNDDGEWVKYEEAAARIRALTESVDTEFRKGTELLAQIGQLEDDLAAARANEARYLWLRNDATDRQQVLWTVHLNGDNDAFADKYIALLAPTPSSVESSGEGR